MMTLNTLSSHIKGMVDLDCAECPNKLLCLVKGGKAISFRIEEYTDLINSGDSPQQKCLTHQLAIKRNAKS